MNAQFHRAADGYYKTVGLDVGYSNLKVAFGSGRIPDTFCMPSGCGPANRVNQAVFADHSGTKGVRVSIKNANGLMEEWLAGVDRTAFGGTRPATLDDKYSDSLEYKALFHAALAHLGASRVSLLVTGLPVGHFLDKVHVQRLKAQLKGRHEVAPGRVVQVDDVEIQSQPSGGFATLVSEADNDQIALSYLDERVLVLDPGFFSFDWALFHKGALVPDASNNSQRAVSAICDDISKYIRQTLDGGSFSRERLEEALRNGDETILIGGEQYRLDEILKEVSSELATHAMQEVSNALRLQVDGINYLYLVGGGAPYFAEAARKAFPRCKVIEARDPVTANARGYFHLGDR